ncbi:hypothetical protein D7V91_04285 [bacterium 1xD42-67]|nr:hypothetical protein D7V91_04285 [bacterium 1xD42-67]
MKIRSMTASFGVLEGARLEPGPGLTLIHAPNEGGKSTWAAFWRAMLYGIDTRERNRKGHLADKDRYQPWSGAPMEGEIRLELEGREILIRRGSQRTAPFGIFSAVYAGTQEPVPGLTGTNCGELLTGVGQEVFTRSAFLGTGNMAVTSAPELERRIAALVSSGEEEVSFSQTMGRLKDWKNKRQVNKSVGEIPRLERELAQVREALEQMEGAALQAGRLEGERAELVRERDRLLRQAEAHRALARKKLSDRYAKAEEEHRAARDQYEALARELRRFGDPPGREDLKQAQGELQYLKVLEEEIKQGSAALTEAEERAAQTKEAAKDEHFPDLSGEEAVVKAETEAAACQAAVRTAGKVKRGIWIFLLLAFGGGIGWAARFLLRGETAPLGPIVGMLAGAAAVTSGAGLLYFCRRRQARRILSRYGVSAPEELTALAQSYQGRCQAAERAAHEVEVIQKAVTERQNKRDFAKVELLDFVHAFAPEVKDMFGCSAALSRALGLEHELALARERVEERRRRLDDLAAQGARPQEGPTLELPVPSVGPEETDRALSQTVDQLERVTSQLDQAQGELRAMGDPAALSARQEALEGALARRREELEAIGLAMEALTQANARLQERFSPELDRRAGGYMARLTGDRYPAVSLSRELEGAVRTGDGVLPRSALYLSRGTADQLYLAVRLAVCQLCLPERPPIFLDDALSAFDDRRLELALELLHELSGEQQILLFTCQKREGEILSGVPGVVQIHL